MTAAEIKKSKSEAVEKILQFLNMEDVDSQFKDRAGDYHSKDKFS